MKEGFIEQESRFVTKRLVNQGLTVKIGVSIYLIVTILFLFLFLFLFDIVGRASEWRLSGEHSGLLRVAILAINSRQQYMTSVAGYHTLSPDTRNMTDTSNSGFPVATVLNKSRFKTPIIIILSTVLYNAEGEAVYYTTKNTSRVPINQKNNGAFQKLASGQTTYVWNYIDHSNSDFVKYDFSLKLRLWGIVRDSNNVHMIGAIAVTINPRPLLSFSGTAKQLFEDLAIINSGNQVVYNRSNTDLNEDDIRLLSNSSFGNDASLYTADLNSGKYRVGYQAIPSTDSVTLFLYRHTPFASEINVVYSYILAGLSLYIPSLFLSIILVSKIITKSLVNLAKSIQQFAEEQQNVKVQFEYTDEIGLPGKAFGDMVLDNEHLRTSEYDLHLENKDAELALMQAQINPYFLYNMFNAIQRQALKSGNKEVADIVYSMTQVFRISLSRGRSIISVKRELDLVSYYLPLQKYRLGRKIDYHTDFDESILDRQIPKLVPQPPVGNSIVHDMAEDSPLNLVISLSVALSEGGKSLHFMIQGNGCGIPPEILRYLPSEVIPAAAEQGQGPNKNNRFVARDIYDRFTLVYGSDLTFRIHNEQGASIEIILPMKEVDERSTSNA